MKPNSTSLIRCLRKMVAPQSCADVPDPQLLEQFLTQRSEAAFAALVRRHGPMVLNVCRRVLGHDQDAEDAFQATFLVLARKAGSIRKHESLGSWLHGVAYRVSRMCKAKEARRLTYQRRIPLPQSADAHDDIHWRELRSVLDEELGKLPEKYRAPLVLCYLEGRTRDEAAQQLGVSKAVFRRRLEYGRDRLARQLSSRGITLSAALSAPLLTDATAQAVLPPLLAANTVRAGLAAAMGQANGTLVSAQVAALAEGGAASLLAKKASAAVVLLVSLMLGVGALLAHRAIQNHTLAEAPAAPPAPVPQSPPVRSASKDQAIQIKGRVLDPDGKPVAGAKVYVSTYTYKDKTDPKVRAETDSDGRFRFTANRTEMDEDEMLAAVAPGYGPDWVSLNEQNELTLHLVKDDVPIKGRVLDLEGRPIAGASVRMVRLWKMPSAALAAGIKELQAEPKKRNGFFKIRDKYEGVLSSVWGILEMPKSTKSDTDGRFQLRGFGRDRIVELRIEGAGIEYRTLTVIIRPGLAKGLPLDLHGPTFDHLAAPSKPIRGTVREKGTGKPIAGIRVGCQAAPGAEGSEAFTDKQGHYEIPGIRKSEQYILNVGYRNPPYINYSKEVGDTPGLAPVTADIEIERALVLHIRATEKGSGKPVRGLVIYAPRSDNKELGRYTTYPRNASRSDVNEKDGTYEQVVLPGSAYIAFRATKGHYVRTSPKGQKDDLFLYGVLPQPRILQLFHAIVPINPSAKDAQSLTCNIVLERGRTLTGTVADPEGRPLSGALAWGMDAVMSMRAGDDEDAHLATPNFTATGLDPRYPRTLIFYHRKKKLAQSRLVRGDEKRPLALRLQPLGAFTGRIVDVAGKPQAGVTVTLDFGKEQRRTLPEEHIFGNSSLNRLLHNQATTDKDGRFRIEGPVAGLKYDLNLGRGENFTWGVRKSLAGKPGAAVDVGEIKMKAPSEKE